MELATVACSLFSSEGDCEFKTSHYRMEGREDNLSFSYYQERGEGEKGRE